MTLARLLAVALTGALAVAATGCPGGTSSREGSPPSHCAQMGERCTLAGGVLGVCSESRCEPGQAPPCIKCTSQH